MEINYFNRGGSGSCNLNNFETLPARAEINDLTGVGFYKIKTLVFIDGVAAKPTFNNGVVGSSSAFANTLLLSVVDDSSFFQVIFKDNNIFARRSKTKGFVEINPSFVYGDNVFKNINLENGWNNMDITHSGKFYVCKQLNKVQLGGLVYTISTADCAKIGTLPDGYKPRTGCLNIACPFMKFNEETTNAPILKNLLIHTDGSIYVLKDGQYFFDTSTQEENEKGLAEVINNNPEFGYYMLDNISFLTV